MKGTEDLYEILQVHYAAEPEVIEAAYRRLLRLYHPDVNKSSQAHDKTVRLNRAYEILRDPAKRSSYDSERSVQSEREQREEQDSQTNIHRLFNAIANRDTELVRTLIVLGTDVGARDDRGATPLHYAAFRGQTEIVMVLIDAGTNLEAKDNTGSTPLHDTVMKGHIETALALIDAGANLDAKNNAGSAPLHYAVMEEHAETVLALIDAGADVGARDDRGATPLHYAAFLGQTEIVMALVDAGANLDARDNAGSTPLHDTVVKGHTETALALIDAGAYVDSETNAGATPLNLAERAGHSETAAAIAARVAPMNDVDYSRSHRSLEGTIPQSPTGQGNLDINNDLYTAALVGSAEWTSELLALGASVNAREEKYRQTPLHAAAWAGHTEIVLMLISAGADVNARNAHGWTPLDWANQQQHKQTASAISSKGGERGKRGRGVFSSLLRPLM